MLSKFMRLRIALAVSKKIFIDVGHGGSDSGAVSDGLVERDMNLVVSLKLKALLESVGFTVYIDRTDNATGIDLDERCKLANDWGADFFISVHHNAGGGDGYEVIHSIYHGAGEEFAGVLASEYQKLGQNAHGVGTYSRQGEHGDYYAVIRGTNMSAIISEFCFIDSSDRSIADTQVELEAEAGAIFRAFCSYYGATPAPTPTPAPSTNLYRVRKSWDDAKSQIGAFGQLDNAKACVDANAGYTVYDWNGNAVYPAPQPAPAPSTDQMYRVRKSWDDAKGQVGAFKVLDNAKELADQHASEGYKVFDKDGNVVYTPASTPAPVTPTPEPKPTPQPDTTAKVNIIGKNDVTVGQMVKFLKDHNAEPKIGIDVKDFCQLFLDEGAKEGVRGDIAFCQSVHETGYFQFGGQVLPEQHNYAGIGATNNSAVGKGAWFKDEEEGITAQIQHLKAYASIDGLVTPCVDPRFSLVTRGIAPYWTDLNGRWAVPGDTYGQMILALYEKLKNTTEPPVVDPTPAVNPDPAPSTDTKVQTLGQIIAEFITKLIEFFKKK